MPAPTDRVHAALTAVPTELAKPAEAQWQSLAPHISGRRFSAEANEWLAALPRVFALSEFVAHACVQHPLLVPGLLESGDLFHAYGPGVVGQRVAAEVGAAADDAALQRRLRILRRREFVRLAWRDLAGRASLDEVMSTLSEFADACIDGALARLTEWALARRGGGRANAPAPASLAVLALGKLGGRELNFSSDVDLIFAYPDDGDADSPRGESQHEFFLKLGQALINTLSEVTEDGLVFRVDMRLRPNGASGALALSFDAMEHYYQTHGREWERYAFIKARACAGDRAKGEGLLTNLRPFVFRRYLDYGALEAIRAMKTMVAREVERKGMTDNIKLGAGGIREIEFIVQTQQLIRAGREPVLQERATLGALARLVGAGHLEPAAAGALRDAYVFLRNTEHRLQMMADRQVHALPAEDIERARLALGMGFADWESFAAALAAHRARVSALFDTLVAFPDRSQEPPGATGSKTLHEDALPDLQQAGYQQPEEVGRLVRGLRDGPAWRALSSEGRTRLDRLIPLLLAATARTRDPLTALARMIRLLEAIGRRTAYFSLLAENPMALAQLVKLAAASPWIAEWIGQHPVLLDELLDPRALYELPQRDVLERQLGARLDAIPEDDLEGQMNALREFRNGHMLRVAAADLGPGVPAEQVGAHLSVLAEVLLAQSLALAERALIKRHGRPQGRDGGDVGFAVIGYGKLGGTELGYASDLDMIFLYEDTAHGQQTAGPRPIPNELLFARLGQRLIHLLTVRTAAGVLYEVDMRLRPSGQSGPLVTSVDAYRDYQRSKAWTWEHQALVRARPVAGTPRVRAEFERVRSEILCLPRDPARLRQDVREMRARMLAAHPAAPDFDVKHARGGIVDIEFMVQYWVLRWAHDYPDAARYTDNINILNTLAGAGLIDPGRARLLVSAYRRYLSVEHRLKLMERGAHVPRIKLDGLPEQVARVWHEVIESGAD